MKEYMTISLPSNYTNHAGRLARLNELAAEGWRLVATTERWGYLERTRV